MPRTHDGLTYRILLPMATLLALLVLVSSHAEAEPTVWHKSVSVSRSAPTTVFDGDNQSVKPAQIGDLTSDLGRGGDSVYIAGRTGNPLDGVGPIRWTSWKKRKAVGRGRGWTDACAATCPFENPWNGTKLRVTAYGKKGGSFRKLKVFQWTRWMNIDISKRENYSMKLKLIGGQWVTTSINSGKG